MLIHIQLSEHQTSYPFSPSSGHTVRISRVTTSAQLPRHLSSLSPTWRRTPSAPGSWQCPSQHLPQSRCNYPEAVHFSDHRRLPSQSASGQLQTCGLVAMSPVVVEADRRELADGDEPRRWWKVAGSGRTLRVLWEMRHRGWKKRPSGLILAVQELLLRIDMRFGFVLGCIAWMDLRASGIHKSLSLAAETAWSHLLASGLYMWPTVRLVAATAAVVLACLAYPSHPSAVLVYFFDPP